MGIFDRWTSNKGKAAKAPSKGEAAEATKKRAFASVPSSQAEPKKKPDQNAKPSSAASETPAKQPAASTEMKDLSQQAFKTLLRPVVTEKSSRRAGQYTFEVHPEATKADVQNAVQNVYGVRPVAVNSMNRLGKMVRYGRLYGRTRGRKKAIVTLPDGKTIDVMNV